MVVVTVPRAKRRFGGGTSLALHGSEEDTHMSNVIYLVGLVVVVVAVLAFFGLR